MNASEEIMRVTRHWKTDPDVRYRSAPEKPKDDPLPEWMVNELPQEQERQRHLGGSLAAPD